MLSPAPSETARLRDRLAEAQERIRQLTDAFAPKPQFPAEWRLTPQQVRLVSILARHEYPVHREAIELALYADGPEPPHFDVIKSQICQIRRKLKPFGITIETRYGFGWRLPPESRAIVRRTMLGAEAA